MRITRVLGVIVSLLLTIVFIKVVKDSYYLENRHASGSLLSEWDGETEAPAENVAFATFLGANLNPDVAHTSSSRTNSVGSSLDVEDGYFLGVRVLAYSLLHHPVTKTNASIPFIVLITPGVSKAKRERLELDGATVVVAERINAGWLRPVAPRYRDVLSKLQLFKMTKFHKICFIDADMLVTDRLDGVFQDPATQIRRTIDRPAAILDDEAPIPRKYLFAGKSDNFKYDHPIPSEPSEYLNGGFFVFMPALEMFEYYKSLIRIPHRFDSSFPEQNLLNYAHRRSGNMPWTSLDWKWNANWPTIKDFEKGIKSFHAKYWDTDRTHDQHLKRKWAELREDMEAFHDGIDMQNYRPRE